ncbi:MAG: hypothetical protein ACRD50_11025 [Candidatus Acidiferrales bacterium]
MTTKPAERNDPQPMPPTRASSEKMRRANLSRHTRKCAICNHSELEAINAEFIRWANPFDIQEEFSLPSRSCIYRHAMATGLMSERRRNLRGVAEIFLENCEGAKPTAAVVLRAMRTYAFITEKGEWIEPPKHTVVNHIHSFAPPPDSEASLKPIPKTFPEAISAFPERILIGTNQLGRGSVSD